MDVLSSPKSFDEVTDIDGSADGSPVGVDIGAVTMTTAFHRVGARPPPQSRGHHGHPGNVEVDDGDVDDEQVEEHQDEEGEEPPEAFEAPPPPSLPQAAFVNVNARATPSTTAALPAPTYPVAGANGSHPRVAAMARYDSFGMDDDDEEEEEEEEEPGDGRHGHRGRFGHRRRGSSHHGYDDYDEQDDDDDDEDVCDELDHDYYHRDDLVDLDDEEGEFDGSYSSFAPPPAPSPSPSRTRSFRPFQSAKGDQAKDDQAPSSSSTLASTMTPFTSTGPALSFPSLPQDALHAIASFSTPGDFARLGSACRASRAACRDVFRRVWRHAFRCVQEVCLAWARGEHGDARELAALYLRRGVPLYPLPLGVGRGNRNLKDGEDWAYGTVEWRMGVEIRETMAVATAEGEERRVPSEERHAYMNGPGGSGGRGGGGAGNARGNEGEGTGDADADADEEGKTKLDPFYHHRFESSSSSSSSFRRSFEHRARNRRHLLDYHDFLAERLGVERFHGRDGNSLARDPFSHSPLPLTYVEEKALFWKKQKGIPVEMDASPPALAYVLHDADHYRHRPRNRTHAHPLWNPPRGNHGQHAPPFETGRGSRRHSLSHPPQFPFRHAWRDRRHEDRDDRHRNGAEEDRDDGDQWTRHPRNDYDDHPEEDSLSLGSTARRSHAATRRNRRASHAGPERGAADVARRRNSGVSNTAPSPLRPAPADTPPKMTLPIHRHLADQHLFGLPSAHDPFDTHLDDSRRRRAVTGDISLDVDFFHPQWNGAVARIQRAYRQVDGGVPSFVDDGEDSDLERDYDPHGDHEERREGSDHRHPDADIRRILYDAMAIRAGAGAGDPTNTAVGGVDPTARAPRPYRRSAGRRHSVQMTPSVETASPHPLGDFAASAPPSSPASDVRLEIYSLANLAASSNSNPSSPAARSVLRARVRCAHRQRLAESHLADYDLPALRECLLDLWDDMLPATAGIHYHNGQTPVPRASHLREFATRPCPKALGTMQCEIVRVKTSPSKKGVNVKGRFFPTYEYRLFIRDPIGDGGDTERRDAVLLVATTKGAGRKRRRTRRNSHLAVPGSSPSAASASASGGENEERTSSASGNKRGVTNYYLRLPQQRDVDVHYRSSNAGSNHPLPPGEKSGLTVSPLADTSNDPVEVGRLQSNFIGTEFQIFSPTTTAAMKPSLPTSATRTAIASSVPDDPPSSSDEDTEGRSGDGDASHRPTGNNRPGPFRRASMDAVIPPAVHSKARRRGSGLVRLARRASLTMTRRGSMTGHKTPPSREHPGDDDPADANAVRDPSPPEDTRPSRVIRRMSWGPSFPTGVKKATRNRRAIANAADESEERGGSAPPTTVVEEECGAITYTANLLGNRPRIMDVCIPIVGEDGRTSADWRDSCGLVAGGEGGDHHAHGGNMLHRFKSIQSRWETPEGTIDPPIDADAAPAATTDHPPHPDEQGLMILQNRPPWWNMELGAFVLNFGGRVSVASVKNFQLCERGNFDAATLVQFGRIQGRHSFTMDFQYPMTPVQAFAIAISSLQSKISFG